MKLAAATAGGTDKGGARLHNQTALLIEGALLFRKNPLVANAPYLLKR